MRRSQAVRQWCISKCIFLCACIFMLPCLHIQWLLFEILFVFNLILDYNGDASVDWDEFTSFCIQTGMGDGNTHSADNEKASNIRSLDEYVIEYGEDVLMRDRVLSSHRRVDVMRWVCREFAQNE